MKNDVYLTSLFTASSLGCGNVETLENYLKKDPPGMGLVSGLLPKREVYFGSVPCELPEIGLSKDNTRTNRLLRLALSQMEDRYKEILSRYSPERIGVVIGASNTGVHEAQSYIEKWIETGKKDEDFDFSMLALGSPAEFLASELGVSGPVYTVSTACSSAPKAMMSARRLIEHGKADVVITGGVDGVCRFAMNGFESLGALSAGRCRPLAPDRDGINLGEGVALFTMEMGVDDGLKFFGGESSDAYHATAPHPEGLGAERAMLNALSDAELESKDIDYINLHGTGTVANDDMELKAVKRVFQNSDVFYESTKSLTGHCLGAAGAVEAAICYLLVKNGKCNRAMSNSFAFGGSNASIIISA
jgi:3-oxoacyl-[acyl-carrier-protein] synthase-1